MTSVMPQCMGSVLTRAIDEKSCANWATHMFQLLIGLIQSRDNRGRHVLSSETTEVKGYENGLMPVFRSCLK